MRRLVSPTRDVRAAAVLVGLLASFVYANSLRNGFAYDDSHIVVSNPAIQSLETLPEALTTPYWPTDFGRELGLWRPVTTGVLGLLYAAGGGSPLAFHVANVLLHAAVSVLVLLICAALMPLPASLAAGLVFAVHPVHVEAVANVVGIAEMLSALALLGACLLHLRDPFGAGWRHALALGGLYAVGFGAKESGVTLPGLIFLLDAARSRLSPADLPAYLRRHWRTYLVLTFVAVALLAARFAVLDSIARPFAPLGADLLREIPRIWTLGEVWTHYVRLWVFPLDLSADYSPNVIRVSLSWHAANVVGVALALGVLVGALVAWRRPEMAPETSTSRVLAFGVVWFVVAISPISNVAFLSGVILAERNLYLASVGLAAASGWLVVRLARERRRAAWGLLIVALGLASARTWTRNPTWQNNQTVFGTMLRDVPHSGRAQWILGDEFLRAGNVSQGLLAYRAAVQILGGHYTIMTDISRRLMEIGRYRTAESLLRFAWRESPELPTAPSLIAWIRAQNGDAEGTEHWARESLALYEADPTRWHLLAWALAAQGEWHEARASRERAEAVARATFWQAWMYLAHLRRHEGDASAALIALDSAWAAVTTDAGRRAIDSVRVAEFGLDPLIGPDLGPPDR
ncbi:MAG TPA: hypothetical protein VLA09_08400 [Longimicrobiales bacterium]|nr:hypothetical protein [Longimicrobiales bacterium]